VASSIPRADVRRCRLVPSEGVPQAHSRLTRYAAHVVPWIIIALVAVPLVVVGFMASRRRTAAGEHPATEDAQARARTEQEFAEAEAYEAKWREKDKERYHQERLP
jgi:hypothetical protein